MHMNTERPRPACASAQSDKSLRCLHTILCLNIWKIKTINFPFVPNGKLMVVGVQIFNGKLMVVGVQIFKHIREHHV